MLARSLERRLIALVLDVRRSLGRGHVTRAGTDQSTPADLPHQQSVHNRQVTTGRGQVQCLSRAVQARQEPQKISEAVTVFPAASTACTLGRSIPLRPLFHLATPSKVHSTGSPCRGPSWAFARRRHSTVRALPRNSLFHKEPPARRSPTRRTLHRREEQRHRAIFPPCLKGAASDSWHMRYALGWAKAPVSRPPVFTKAASEVCSSGRQFLPRVTCLDFVLKPPPPVRANETIADLITTCRCLQDHVR